MSHPPKRPWDWQWDNRRIWIGAKGTWSDYACEIRFQDKPDAEASAEHIVRCVNSHDALVEIGGSEDTELIDTEEMALDSAA